MRAPVSTMQAPVFGGFMRVVSKRGHVTHGPASILQAPVFGGFMRVVIGRGYETHGPTAAFSALAAVAIPRLTPRYLVQLIPQETPGIDCPFLTPFFVEDDCLTKLLRPCPFSI